ncbi:MAG: Maf family protein [Puniceicoccales bacterium]|jgi:septum formation protein|nr:Maf family protein [Puniceicoccales bacterium]
MKGTNERIQIILASASPRRKELLAKAGVSVEIVPADVVEHEDPNSCPREMVLYNAELKAVAIAEKYPDALVIGADTTVAVDDTVLNKPRDMAEARFMIRRLSGRTHVVYTGVCFIRKSALMKELHCVTSRVVFKDLSEDDITRYFQLVNPLDKAGAYGIQEGRDINIDHFEGPISNIMGLPVEFVVERLRQIAILKED